jgi:hypothetical protein
MRLAEDPDGVFAEVDETRPTLARQTNEVRGNLADLMERCIVLREEVRRESADVAHKATASLERTRFGPAAGADLGDVRQRVLCLVDELRQNMHAERLLVLDSIMTDIGVCD